MTGQFRRLRRSIGASMKRNELLPVQANEMKLSTGFERAAAGFSGHYRLCVRSRLSAVQLLGSVVRATREGRPWVAPLALKSPGCLNTASTVTGVACASSVSHFCS